MMSYTDYDLCDYRDSDYELLAYLEQWERAQPKPPATSEQITVSTTRDLMRATKNSERQEFKNILAEMQETANLVAAMTASGPGDTVLDEMVTEHQYPRSKKISWIHACKYDLLNFYCVRCVQLKKILSRAGSFSISAALVRLVRYFPTQWTQRMLITILLF